MATDPKAHAGAHELSAGGSKKPRTARGERTRRKLLDAAMIEFAERGFYEASIAGITRRAGVALGSFYTYFENKEALFRDLVRHLSETVRLAAKDALETPRPAIEAERAALEAFLHVAQENSGIYRIIDEAEFVIPESFREHYMTTAGRVHQRLKDGAAKGEVRGDVDEVHAWAIMGMNVFLGLRYAVWGDGEEDLSDIAAKANALLERGIGPARG